MSEVIREFEAPLEGNVIARVYASSNQGRWQAWIEFISLDHGFLRRSAVTWTFSDRRAVLEWAEGLDEDELSRALEDAELASAGELGRTPA